MEEGTMELGLPDAHHVRAAQGWLELGNLSEAQVELGRISMPGQQHPAVLEVRWNVLASERRWREALRVASRLVALAPQEPAAWVHHSYTLHELNRTREAWELLSKVVERFPAVGVIPYNLACYACQLGDQEQAWVWLERAARVLGAGRVREMAAHDADLASLRERIRDLR